MTELKKRLSVVVKHGDNVMEKAKCKSVISNFISSYDELSCKRTINTSEKISPKCELALDRISQTCTSAGIAPLTKRHINVAPLI
ncbi:hypothetical protein TrVE_jg2394 [Triparma verrucosa]|uniref:Uncharacterized protein n=2 Tax=Triparma TaxID=722752 RepID=A0A9W7C683_9STRA|nr:hypothetical protein TrVE_jg2394 [Triparma verrucosa]GMI00757.1 hypothetical protein TrST_g5016 [Triparma strigata]